MVLPIYVINLQERLDRLKEVQAQLKKHDLLKGAYFYRPKKHPQNGHIGCYESHQAILRLAYEKKQPWILIFEDDLVLDETFSWLAIHTALYDVEKEGGEILFLGHASMWMSPIYPYACKSLQTHAYVINVFGKMATSIREQPWGGKNIDYIFLRDAKSYGLFPSIAFQKGFSDSNTETRLIFHQKLCIYLGITPKLAERGFEYFYVVLLPTLLLWLICLAIYKHGCKLSCL